jgi:hypothetical protein
VRPRTLAERAAFIPAVIGPLFGVLFLFAPIQGYCSSTITATPAPPGQTPGPGPTSITTCGTEALWQRQEIFPMPFFAVLVWSLGPVVAYYGVRRRLAGQRGGTALIITGLLMTFSSIVSFGGGFLFVPFVFLPMLVTSLIALRSAAPPATSPPSYRHLG